MAVLNITQETYDALNTSVNDLIALQNSYISDRDLLAAVAVLEQEQSNLNNTNTSLGTSVTTLNSALNALSIRFRRYAADANAISNASAQLPSSDEKAALVGTFGTPNAVNKYVTDVDPRLIDARVPTLHAASHSLGMLDEISHLNLADVGTKTHATLELDIAGLLSTTGTHTTDIGTLQTDVGLLQTFQTGLTLDTIPLGPTYTRVTNAEANRIPTTNIYDATNVIGASAVNQFITENIASSTYQLLGTYVTPTYLGSIAVDLLPDITEIRSLGSATKRWKTLFLKIASINLGNSVLSVTAGNLTLDGITIADTNNIDASIVANTEVAAATGHVNTLHDWSLIASNTLALNTITATDISSLVGHNHNTLYYTQSSLDTLGFLGTGVFSSYAKTNTISNGGIALPWSALTGIPTLASANFKGTVATYNDLPLLDPNMSNGDVYIVQAHPSKATFAAVYTIINPGSSTRANAYKSTYNPDLILHADLPDLLADHHTQYYNLSRLNIYISTLGVTNTIKANLGITSIGSGNIITAIERVSYDLAYAHTGNFNNPHSITPENITAIRDTANIIKPSHIDFGVNAVNTDVITEGNTNLWATATLFADVNTALLHSVNSAKHLSAIERSDLLGLGNTTVHYHNTDRDLSNATGTLTASFISDFSTAVTSITSIANVITNSHSEIHTLVSHDTTVTGSNLNTLWNTHGNGVLSDGHNAQFSISGGANGLSNRIARQDHIHNEYVLATTFQQLGASGASQQIHWGNLIGVPSTVGNTRNFVNLAALNAATPSIIGEQVIVIDYDGLGNWAIYVSVSVNIGDWTLIASQDGGLTYASVTHNHDTVYQSLTTFITDVDTEIASYFSSPAHANDLVSITDRSDWDTALVNTNVHIADGSIHVLLADKSSWDSAVVHSNDTGVHLTVSEKNTIASFNSSVTATDITSGSTTQSLQLWIDGLSSGSSVSITNLIGWPSHINATVSNLAKLFDGSDVSNLTILHTHDSKYSSITHTHLSSDITDFAAEIIALGYKTQTEIINLFTLGIITSSDIQEGTNKYVTEANLQSINTYSQLLTHMADNEPDKKHLTDGQRNALTGGLLSKTYLHSHEGLHYIQDAAITIGVHSASTVNTVDVGEAGLVKADRIAAAALAPVSGASLGTIGEFRVDNSYAYFKCPDNTWRRVLLTLIP